MGDEYSDEDNSQCCSMVSAARGMDSKQINSCILSLILGARHQSFMSAEGASWPTIPGAQTVSFKISHVMHLYDLHFSLT